LIQDELESGLEEGTSLMSGEETVKRTRHARALLETWRIDYNTNRPHSRLGWMSPTAYAVHSGPLR
jgi:hypothetical protein